MAFSLVAKTLKISDIDPDKVTETSGLDTTGANLLVVGIAQYGSGTDGTVTDSKSNTWNEILDVGNRNSFYARMFYSIPSSVGSSHTVTYTTSAFRYPVITFAAFSGASATQPDVDNQNGAGASSILAGSVTPSAESSLIVTVLSTNYESPTINLSFVYTDTVTASSAGRAVASGLAYLIHTSGEINPTWSWTTSGDAATKIAVFAPAASGPTLPVFMHHYFNNA